MSKAKFEDILNEKGELIYTNVGDSMYPLIQPRDLLIIKKCDGLLKKYDIPLYKRDSGQYVLHRIIKVRKHDYVICGDNRHWKETGITDKHILGVLTGIVRNGQIISLDTPPYRRYARKLFLRRWRIALKERI